MYQIVILYLSYGNIINNKCNITYVYNQCNYNFRFLSCYLLYFLIHNKYSNVVDKLHRSYFIIGIK